jgi:hypothetical protein
MTDRRRCSAASTIGYAPRGGGRNAAADHHRLPQSARSWSQHAGQHAGRGDPPGHAAAGRARRGGDARRSKPAARLFRRDGRAADMVTAELAGDYEAPIYGMLAVNRAIDGVDWAAKGLTKPEVRFATASPTDEIRAHLLWDGEWEITWVTFRDMGAAFGWRCSASMCWWWRSSAASSCRWSS